MLTHLERWLLLFMLIGTAQAAHAWTPESAVREVAALVEARYAREDLARRYAETLRSHQAQGRYAALTDGRKFAEQLTADLQAVHPDLHLRVRFSPTPLPPDEPLQLPGEEELAIMRREQLRDNLGFERVEVYPGNLGYLSFRYFGDPTLGATKLDAAMTFLADTDALLIDLRYNAGATDAGLMDLLNRYLLPDADIVTTRVAWRGADPGLTSTGPAPVPAGPRYLGKPVFQLISGGTFSGAEGFAYNLQALRRVQVVGQRTAGAANPGRELRAGAHFAVWVPLGIVTHPLTQSNWEGRGVQPDIAVHPREALTRARIAALETLLVAPQPDTNWRQHLQDQLAQAREALAEPAPGVPVTFRLSGHGKAREVSVVGSFNGWAPRSDPMRREGGTWVARLPIEPGQHRYKFWVDGLWLTDPNPARRPPPGAPDDNARLHVKRPR